MEGTTVIYVLSNAGYGLTVRGYYENQALADAKMARLAKKGHKDIESHVAQVVEIIKYEVQA